MQIKHSISCVYKLTCISPSVNDIYIGSTFDFGRRMSQHKYHTNTKSSEKYDKPLYQKIRCNGGWNNWKKEILHEVNTYDKVYLKTIERQFIEMNNENCINKNIPNRTQNEFNKYYYENHKKYFKDYYNRHVECLCCSKTLRLSSYPRHKAKFHADTDCKEYYKIISIKK